MDGCKALSVQQKGVYLQVFFEDLAQVIEQDKDDPFVFEISKRGSETSLRAGHPVS